MTRPPMARPILSDTAIERWCEKTIFASRWLLAPIYLGLAASLLILLIKFAQRTIELFSGVLSTSGSSTIVEVLSLIDLSLMANLVLMVMFAGYENFISKLELDGHHDKPDWMGRVGFGDLKLRLMASIVAISAIHLLENFMSVEAYSDRALGWTVGIHLAFIVSAVLLALMDRISGDQP